jgi:hemerythrin-like domain-containing protein
MGVTAVLQEHHKLCDEDFAAAEEAAQRRDWSACAAAFGKFREGLLAHFGVEEEQLFPAFERQTGMTGGPTQVMRYEHGQMRDLVSQLEQAQAQRDAEAFSGAAETLLVLMQQHNMKEENILYPMCDQALGGDGELKAQIDRALHG